MTAKQIVPYLFFWGLLGCSLFFILVVLLFRTGLVYTARKEDGTLKDEIPTKGKLAMLIVPVSYLILQFVSIRFGLVRRDVYLNFGSLYLLNFGIYLILFLFDTGFIDGFVLTIWRPAFLLIPAAMGKESLRKHILISLPIGLLVGVFVNLISTTIAYFWWFNYPTT